MSNPGRRVLGKLGKTDRLVKIVGNRIMEYIEKGQESVLVMGKWGMSREIAPCCEEHLARVRCNQPYPLLLSPPYYKVVPLVPRVVRVSVVDVLMVGV